MNPFKVLVLLICCLPIHCIAIQEADTIYYNRDWNETKSIDSIAYYRILSKKDGIYHAKDYFLSGQLQMEGSYKSFDPDIREGYFKFYDSLGFMQEEGNHINNKREGKWIEYIPRKNKVGIISYFRNDSLNGTRTVYYLEGNVQWLDSFVNDKKEGKCISYYRYSGIVETEIEFKNNKPNGLGIFYDSVGSIKSTGRFIDGKKQGVWTTNYKSGGELRARAFYKGDTVNGPFTYFYRSGNKMLEGNRVGKYRQDFTAYYDADGKIKKKETIINDKREGWVTYFDSAYGKVKAEGLYENDVKQGEWKFYYEGTDKLSSVEHYNRGELNGGMIVYFVSGAIKGNGNFKNGRKDGKYNTYFESGKIKYVEDADGLGTSKCVFHDSLSGKVIATGSKVDGLKDGEWLYYYPGTDVVKTKEYIKKGVGEGPFLTYYKDGSKRIVGQFKNDEREGKWIYYYSSGKEWIKRNYKKGRNDGELISYHENGTVKRKEKWLEGVKLGAQCFSEFGEEVTYTKLYQAPEFDGDISTFVGRELQYPESAEQAGIEGKVVVEFVVNEDGELSDFTIKKSVSRDCDEEAIRVVSKMDKWKPAQLDGQILKETATVPVVFWIRDKDGE